jgi:hypothetical protein
MNQPAVGKIAFALGSLLGQNVTLEGVLSFDFTCPSELKALFGTGYGFHFWHDLYGVYLLTSSFLVESS